MKSLLQIAFRNLLEHRSKTLIIGILLAVGVIVLVVGNSLMDTAAKGAQDSYTTNYTGDVFIAPIPKTAAKPSLFGFTGKDYADTLTSVPDFDRIEQKLISDGKITAMTPQVSSFALASVRNAGQSQGYLFLFGIDPDSYFKTFPGFKVVEGRLLKSGETGLMMSKRQVEKFKENFDISAKVGQDILLTSMGGKAGLKIRAVPLVGIIEFQAESQATEYISYSDASTVRILSGMNLGSDIDDKPTAAQVSALSASDEDFFGESTIIAGDALAKKDKATQALLNAQQIANAKPVDAAWNFILARLKDPAETTSYIASLNAWFSAQGIGVTAGNWKAAAGDFAMSTEVVRIIFVVAVIIVAIVALIIMMNTLVISVMERTGEIGTMRALGARRSYIWRLFFAETLAIAIVFGLIGTVLAYVILVVTGAMHIPATNEFLRVLFGGPIFAPRISIASSIYSLLLVAGVAIAAHIYPVSIAIKVQPVRAMQQE